MNILIVTESFPPHAGGSGWSTYQLCSALKKQGHRMLVAKIDGKETSYNGITIIPVKNKGDLKRIVAKHAIEVVHAQHMRSTCLSAGLGVPLVVTLRDYWPLSYKGTLFDDYHQHNYSVESYAQTVSCLWHEHGIVLKILSPLAAIYLRWRTSRALRCLQQADRVICVSDFVKKKISPYLPEQNLVVIPNMIDTAALSSISPAALPKKTIVYTGKMTSSKGIMVLAEAVRDLPVELVLIGEGPLKERASLRLDSLHIPYRFLDYVDNSTVLQNMKGASMVVVPSAWHEPLGRTILEGLGVGAAIIASSTGGTPEIIIDHESGLLFDGSAEDLHQKIAGLLKHPALITKMQSRAQERAAAFDVARLIGRFEEVYSSLIQQSRR